MLISDRSKEIIEYLMNANGPVTVSDLAKELQVTERTIYRQMSEVSNIIESFGLTLDHSSGKGMMIFGSLYNIKRLSSAFEEVKTEQNYSARERVDMIILILLNADDYVKTQSLAIDLNTSSQTVRNDFSSVKEKIHSRKVWIIPKVLREIADSSAITFSHFTNICAVKGYFPRSRLQYIANQPHHGCFARAICPKQAINPRLKSCVNPI